MRRLLINLWKQQDGIIVTSEIILVGTILVLGSIAGLSTLSYAVSSELMDAANAVDSRGSDRHHGNTYKMSSSKPRPEIAGRYGR
ncbi:MAG: hypothetical protein GY758_30180 [Fuerstiella sp.]|nr:hypothetical protein [Fuerstiella sp.]MCP4507932.1 hypothetical protein [Fuerstiella sp.]MDG2129660.1 hypothetical protein [Fuerstiella sp.]